MLKFIGKALAGLVLTREAQQTLSKQVKTKTAPRKAAAPAAGSREELIREAQAKAEDLVTPDRAELIRRAMEVRKAKQTILADLSDEDRQRLVAAAMKRLLRE